MTQIITLILDESINANEYYPTNTSNDYGTLIHQYEFEHVIGIIKKNIPDPELPEKKNQHNTITILGSRGSGKTSFLLSIKENLKNNEKDIEVLEIIDPTLIEEKGHVFLNVISLIKDLVEKKLDKEECYNSYTASYVVSKKEWRDKLNKLAAGLPSIDGIGNNNNIDGWQDPEFIMDNGLRAVHASQKLSDNFNKFLKCSLKLLGKKVFLLMFDDIDVEAKKGWAVLETIRKYFTGDKLITIVSGDIQLYSTVVRQKKWESFGKEILNYEGEKLGKLATFNDMVTELESQYLQKILQPKNRFHLLTLGESGSDKQVYVYQNRKSVKLDQKNTIKETYKLIVRQFGINNDYQSDLYTNFLLGLPLRTQIQFLNLFKFNKETLEENRSNFTSLTDIFLSDLYEKGIQTNTINKNTKNLNRLILKFLLKEKALEELYQLQPITTDASLNASLISLNFILSDNIKKDPYLIFDYFIKIGYIRNILPILGYRDKSENKITPSIEDLCNNTVVLNDNILKDIAGKITAYLRGTIDLNQRNSERVSKAGSIPLYGEALKAKRANDEIDVGRIDSVLKNKNANIMEVSLAYLPLTSNQYLNKQSSLLTYSSYVLLGAIGELFRKVKLNDEKNGIVELSQLRAYVMPDFKKGSGMDENPEEIQEEIINELPEKEPFILDLFKEWIDKYFEKNVNIPNTTNVHLLGKISTRFYHALNNLENKIPPGEKLGYVFSAHIVAFMNAVLVEDCRENSNFAHLLNLNNTNYSKRIFIDNLKKITDLDNLNSFSNLHFSRWLLSCPLLLVYLNKSDNINTLLIKFCKDNLNQDIFKIDLQKILGEISIKNEDKISISATEKENELGISINDQMRYNEIFSILTDSEFDFKRFFKENANSLNQDLGNLGIIRVTDTSVKKFIRFLEKNNKI